MAVGEPLVGHTRSVNSEAYSPDGLFIESGSNDSTVRIWDGYKEQCADSQLAHAELATVIDDTCTESLR